MARTYEELKAEMAEKRRAAESAKAAAPQVELAPVAPASPFAVPEYLRPPAELMAPEGLEVFEPAPKAKRIKKAAAPATPSVTRTEAGVPPKPQEIFKTPGQVAEQAREPEIQTVPKAELTPDMRREVDWKKFYDSVGTEIFKPAKRRGAEALQMTEAQLEAVAQAQGVSLEAINEAKIKGRTYEEVARANRERGVLGFMPLAEREVSFSRTVDDFEKAQRGEASEGIRLKKSGADQDWTGGYVAMGTRTALPEVSKPGEYGHLISETLIEALQKDPKASAFYDLYGRKIATGNTQKYIEERTKDLMERAGVGPSDPDSFEKRQKLRRRAINEILAYKTIGMWTPAITMQDVQVTEGVEAPGFFASVGPNIELVGINNKGQAIYRQESPLGVLFRAIDIPQEAIVAKLEGRSAAEGIQTGANFLEYAMEHTEGESPYVRYPALAAGFIGAVAMPDLLIGPGMVAKGAKAAKRFYDVRKIAPRVLELLTDVAEARKTKDMAKAKKAEVALRDYTPQVADMLDRYDAAAARRFQMVDPVDEDIFNENVSALLATLDDEGAKALAAERVHLHPSMRKPETAAKLPTKEETYSSFDELFNTDILEARVSKAKADYIATAPKTVQEHFSRYAKGLTRSKLEAYKKAKVITQAELDDLARIVEASTAPALAGNMGQWKSAIQSTLKAHPVFGDPKFAEIRKAVYVNVGKSLGSRAKSMVGLNIGDLNAADMAAFDRALTAISRNSEARGVAATLLHKEVADQAKIRVQPLELFDDVALTGPGGEAIRLTPGGVLFLTRIRNLLPEVPFKDVYAESVLIDKIVIARARKEGRDPFSIYEELFPEIRAATKKDIKRYKTMASGGGPVPAPAGAPTAGVAGAGGAPPTVVPPVSPVARPAVTLGRARFPVRRPAPAIPSTLDLDVTETMRRPGEELNLVLPEDVDITAAGGIVRPTARQTTFPSLFQSEAQPTARVAGEPTGEVTTEVTRSVLEPTREIPRRRIRGELARLAGPESERVSAETRLAETRLAEEVTAPGFVPLTAAQQRRLFQTEAEAEALAAQAPEVVALEVRLAAGAQQEQAARRQLAAAAGESDEAFDAALAAVDVIAAQNRAVEAALETARAAALSRETPLAAIRKTIKPEAPTAARVAEESAVEPVIQRVSEPAVEVAVEPVIQRATAAEAAAPLPVARKAKGFSDKNSLNAGVYEVEVGGQTRRFFRDTKEGPVGVAWVEDVRGDANMPITFLGNTKDDAIKALQRKYGAEEAPAAARAAEEVVAEAAPAVERVVEAAPAAKAEEAVSEAPTQPFGITPAVVAPVVAAETSRDLEKFLDAVKKLKTPKATEKFLAAFQTAALAPGQKVRVYDSLATKLEKLAEAEEGDLVLETLADTARTAERRSRQEAERVLREGGGLRQTGPASVTPVAEVPVVREEIVTPPAVPPVKAEPTVDELQATVDRLAPLRDAPIKRTNVSKTGFTIEIDGQQIRVQKSDDNWVNAATGRKLGETASDAVEKLRVELIQKPYTAAQDALERLGKVQAQAATLSSLDDALASVKKIRTTKDAEKFFEVVDQLPLDEAERLDVLSKLKGKLDDLAAKAKNKDVKAALTELATRAEVTAQEIRPAAAEAPSAAAAAQDALTAQQRHAQAVSRMRTLTHRVEAPRYVVYGALENERFVPAALVTTQEARTPSSARAALYDQLTVSDAAFDATRREAESLLEGQTPAVRAFPGNKYANDADLEFGGLRQTGPAGVTKGVTELRADGRSIIILFEGADPTTVLHEVAHIMRRNVLDVEDMNAITGWLTSRGINVSHQYGEFIGAPDEVEKAEEFFAKAFEQYALEGAAPTPMLQSAFDTLKQAVAQVYLGVSDPVIGVKLQPEVRRVFDGLVATVDDQPNVTLKQVLRRELLGAEDDSAEGFLNVLSREAQRKGMPRTALEDLQKQFETAKKNRVAANQTYVSFPAPVLGKRDWSFDDLAEFQAARTTEREIDAARKKGIFLDLSGKGLGTASVVEKDAVEELRAYFAYNKDIDDANKVRGKAKAVVRAVIATFFGGDVVAEKGGAQNLLRFAPPEFRQALDAAERPIAQGITDTITLVNDAIDIDKRTELYRYLGGAGDVRRVAGRPILSAGHDYMGSVIGMIRRSIDDLKPEERAALETLAEALNSPNRSSALVKLGFDPKSGDSLALVDASVIATREAASRAMSKLLFSTQDANADFGASLASAIRGAVEAPANIARPTHEMLLVENLTYISGLTQRNGALFTGTSQDAAKVLLEGDGVRKGVAQIYDDESARRMAVAIGGFGSSVVGKDTMVKLNLGIDADTYRAFVNWTNGQAWDFQYTEAIQRVVDRYGYNVEFVRDAVLDTDFYIPRLARDRMAESLARATYRPTATVTGGDAFNILYRYMKKRMTRGSFFLRQRYYMMNTVDHFMQMALTSGFGVAAASVSRVLVQDVMVLPFWQQLVDFVARRLPGGKRIPVDLLERFRAGLQVYGDKAANNIATIFSVGKYRIEVNPILEGVDGGFQAGGKVYGYRQIRDIAVQEGVFASFDTSQLASVIEREGALFAAPTLRGASATGTAGGGIPAGLRNFMADWEKTVSETAEAWGERERLGAMITLMEAGHDPRTAARITIDALYDYSQSMTKADRSMLVGILFPFWAFQKNANAQVFNNIFSPWGAYRLMVLKRARERGAELLTEVLYNDIGGEYGLDVKSMPPELQDNYYAIVTAFEDSYKGQEPPEDAKRALKMLFTGRGRLIEEGKLAMLSPELKRLRDIGAFADLQSFAEYTALRPSASGRQTYLRDRTGVAMLFPRTKAVQMYYRLAGDDHSYMEMFIPESSIEAGMRHHTQLAATYLLLSASALDLLPGIDLKSQGLEEVKALNVLKPIADPARSPILAPLLSGTAMGELAAPKRVSTKMSETAALVTRVHPFIGKMMDDMYGTTFVRVPAIRDPFVTGVDGNFVELTDKAAAEIRELQKEFPDVAVLRDERYYLPGGVWTTMLENSPLGELNSLLLRYEENPLERNDIRGEIMSWARGAAGVDVELVSPQKTIKREEPKKLKETPGTR